MMMLFCKFAVVTELKRRLNQAFSSTSHPCGRGPNKEISLRNSTSKASWEWDDEFKRILSHSPSTISIKGVKICLAVLFKEFVYYRFRSDAFFKGAETIVKDLIFIIILFLYVSNIFIASIKPSFVLINGPGASFQSRNKSHVICFIKF